MDCGPTCLRMICKHYKRDIAIHYLRELCLTDRGGVDLYSLSQGAEQLGFDTGAAMFTLEELTGAPLPCIIHWKQCHFAVLYKIKNNKYYVANPQKGLLKLNEEEFLQKWLAVESKNSGIGLLLNPSINFYNKSFVKPSGIDFLGIVRYYLKFYKQVIQVFGGFAIGMGISIVLPFLTQSIVDIGISSKNVHYIYLILIAQVVLFTANSLVSFLRSRTLLFIGSKINLKVVTKFLIKLMKLQSTFFESKTVGDIVQRMNDQQKIETFLSGNTINSLFSLANLLVFSVILICYSKLFFIISLACTIAYSIWVIAFMNRRKRLNQNQFSNSAENQSYLLELINGIKDIKLANCEREKRWEWERLQVRLFKSKVETLTLSQYQQIGSVLINQIRNVIITYLSVKAVMDGQLTLGGMIAVQYITVQVSAPIEQLIEFSRSFQDAHISLERVNEIHELQDEGLKATINGLPLEKTVKIKNLSFKYSSEDNYRVLKGVDFVIPESKTTAIVGLSGSGKTTLLKILLRLYEPPSGAITIGAVPLENIDLRSWRNSCGAVLQDSYIFSDSIESNISLNKDHLDMSRLMEVIRIVNLTDFISELPSGLKTKIGSGGIGLSQGQKQRVLIARAIYKNPHYLFLDEATNALDASNERIIIENLKAVFEGRTVLIIAHRLSSIKDVDNIILLNKGTVQEQGTHDELILKKGAYYELVCAQL